MVRAWDEHCNKYRPFIYDNIVIIYTSLIGVIVYGEASLKQTEGVVRQRSSPLAGMKSLRILYQIICFTDYLQRKVSFQLLLSSTVLFYTATTLENEEHVETKIASLN